MFLKELEMLLLIILAVLIALLFGYSLVTDKGKNTKFARKGISIQAYPMEQANMVELS